MLLELVMRFWQADRLTNSNRVGGTASSAVAQVTAADVTAKSKAP